MTETSRLYNVNMISQEKYNEIADPTKEDLWVVEVETYNDNDRNWYRVYPDGWCEQGGYLSAAGTVTFLKPFINIQYGIFHTPIANASPYVSARTNTTMTVAGGGMYWMACGYIN